MSRLGDMIHNERIQRGLGAKEVAKTSGVTEKYLLEVEGGGRIINDDAARRILKAMGNKAEIIADFEAMSSGEPTKPAPVRVAVPKADVTTAASTGSAQAPLTPTAAWMDAMGGVIKQVPIRNAQGKEIGHRMLPTQSGKVEGAPPEKVFYLECPDTSMRGYRLYPGDHLLVVPATSAVDGATMVITEGSGHMVRRVSKQDGNRVLLQWFDAEPQSKVCSEKDVQWLGRVLRCEFTL